MLGSLGGRDVEELAASTIRFKSKISDTDDSCDEDSAVVEDTSLSTREEAWSVSVLHANIPVFPVGSFEMLCVEDFCTS